MAALKKESLMKDEAIKVPEERTHALAAECKQNDELIIEVLSSASEAEEVAKLATERLLLFASMLDQIASSSCADLLVVVDMDASLGLALFDGEYLESPKFVRDMVDHLPRLKTIIEALLEVVIAGGSNKSMAFMESFLRSWF